jgi:hypothetical protein
MAVLTIGHIKYENVVTILLFARGIPIESALNYYVEYKIKCLPLNIQTRNTHTLCSKEI